MSGGARRLGMLLAALLIIAIGHATARADEKPAPQSGHAYSECKDGFWWVVSYSLDSDGKTLVKTYERQTGQACAGGKKTVDLPPGFTVDEVGPAPDGPCLTEADIKYAQRLRSLYDLHEQAINQLLNELKGQYRELDRAEKDKEGHLADAQEAIERATAQIRYLKRKLKAENAAMRFITERLAAVAQKQPCEGVTEQRPEQPVNWPLEIPPADDLHNLPDRPPGTCYSNADNLYEQQLKDLLKAATDKRDALYEQLKPLIVAEYPIQEQLADKYKEYEAVKPPDGLTLSPTEADRKAALKGELEAIRLALDDNLGQQATVLLQIQALDAAISAIEQRLSLPPKPPCEYSSVTPPNTGDEHASVPDRSVTDHVLTGVGATAAPVGAPNRGAADDADQPAPAKTPDR